MILDTAPPAPPYEALVDAVRRAIPSAVAVYVYGSWAHGLPRADSDLDLSVLLPPGQRLATGTLFELSAELAYLAGRAVDVVVLDLDRSVILCKEVVTGGRLLFAADPAAVREFEMRVLGAYARLTEDRRPVLAAYVGGSHG